MSSTTVCVTTSLLWGPSGARVLLLSSRRSLPDFVLLFLAYLPFALPTISSHLHAAPFIRSLLRDDWNVSFAWEGHFSLLLSDRSVPTLVPQRLVFSLPLPTLCTGFFGSLLACVSQGKAALPRDALNCLFHSFLFFFSLPSVPVRLVLKRAWRLFPVLVEARDSNFLALPNELTLCWAAFCAAARCRRGCCSVGGESGKQGSGSEKRQSPSVCLPGPPLPEPGLRLGRNLPPLSLFLSSLFLPHYLTSTLLLPHRLSWTLTKYFCSCITSLLLSLLFCSFSFTSLCPRTFVAKMYRNPWISNYLTHVKFCSQGKSSDSELRFRPPTGSMGTGYSGCGLGIWTCGSWQATNCRLSSLPLSSQPASHCSCSFQGHYAAMQRHSEYCRGLCFYSVEGGKTRPKKFRTIIKHLLINCCPLVLEWTTYWLLSIFYVPYFKCLIVFLWINSFSNKITHHSSF